MWGSILILKVSKWLNYFLGAQRALVASVLRNPKKIQYRAAFPVVFIIFFQMCGSYCKRSRILSLDIEQLVSVMLSKLCSLTDVLNINRLFVIMLVWCSTLCRPLSIPVFQWPNHFGYPFLAVSAFAYLGMWPPLLPWRRHLAFGAKIANMLNPMVRPRQGLDMILWGFMSTERYFLVTVRGHPNVMTAKFLLAYFETWDITKSLKYISSSASSLFTGRPTKYSEIRAACPPTHFLWHKCQVRCTPEH